MDIQVGASFLFVSAVMTFKDSGSECGTEAYPKGATGQLENDRPFIGQLVKVLKKDIFKESALNTSPGAKPKSTDTKYQLIYKRVFCNCL